MSSDRFDLIVIGAGITGLTAACEAARGGARVACFGQLMFGGLVTNVHELDPAPEGVSGSVIALASALMGHIGARPLLSDIRLRERQPIISFRLVAWVLGPCPLTTKTSWREEA